MIFLRMNADHDCARMRMFEFLIISEMEVP